MPRLSGPVCLLFAAAVSFAAAEASAANPKARKHAPEPASASVGSPNNGSLVGGRRLEHTAHLRAVGANRWGLPELVGMLTRSADRVAKRYPQSILTVGDLSKRGGGDIGGHHSHESGRDADVAFYLERRGKAFIAPRFATIDPEGRALRMAGVHFDDARNWALVEAWLTDSEARVLQIFVVDYVRTRLIAYAAASGVSAGLRARAAAAMLQPRHALPHDNHFHVRLACPKSSPACIDYSTRQAPAAVARAARARVEPRPSARAAGGHAAAQRATRPAAARPARPNARSARR